MDDGCEDQTLTRMTNVSDYKNCCAGVHMTRSAPAGVPGTPAPATNESRGLPEQDAGNFTSN